ncbi:hypothetical protein HNR19_000709 [Nocardioides thalensis]|uniref:Uncharacterized protein n=1 Tax=Nocardioides thalensis TaxID=1914755 RepID=A0A853BYH9_9ACTN|nr:hypothetical protein [Nocardioides thalensis]NYJ00011.1 hypothetical protein [Nocardioides thalensis]
MKKIQMRITGLLAAVIGVALLGGLVAGVADADETGGPGGRLQAPTQQAPHPKTIVKVTGDAANGFGVHYLDGTAEFPPTDSEAAAECGEYDRVIERVRCRTEVRTWYHDLASMQWTIRYFKAKLRDASSDEGGAAG